MTHTFELLRPQDWPRLTDFLFEMRDRKVRLTVTVKPYRKRRSSSQNAFYWSYIVTPLAQHCGYTVDEMHDLLLRGYYGTETKEFRGLIIHVPRRRSTTPETADTLDFMGLIQHGQQIAAELGVRLPDQADSHITGA